MSTVLTIAIDRPGTEVWDYLCDYGNDHEWREGIVEMTPTPPGPSRVGTTTHEVLRFAGSEHVNDGVVLAVDGHRLEWEASGAGTRASGWREVLPDGHGCVVRMRTDVEVGGLMRAAAPVLRRMFAHQMQADLGRLRDRLEQIVVG